MKRIVLLTALVITSLCAWAQQLRTPSKMAESNREYLQHGVRHITSSLGQKSMQRYSMQPTDRLMRTDLNSRRIAAKTRITNYELVDKQPAGEVKMFYRSSKNYYTAAGTNFQTDDQHGLMKSVIYNEEGETADGDVVVAIDGDKLYMNTILDLDPKATLVGTIKGNKVEFATDQYLGLYPKADATAYFGGAKYRIEQEEVIPGMGFMMDHWYYDVTPSLVMDYDAEKRTLTAPEGTTFLLNATKPSVDVIYIWALSDAYFAFKSEIAGIDDDLSVEGKEVKSVKYFNLKGMQIAKPEKGVCIQAVTFTDGSTMTKKMVR